MLKQILEALKEHRYVVVHLPTIEQHNNLLLELEENTLATWGGGGAPTSKNYWEECTLDFCLCIRGDLSKGALSYSPIHYFNRFPAMYYVLPVNLPQCFKRV